MCDEAIEWGGRGVNASSASVLFICSARATRRSMARLLLTSHRPNVRSRSLQLLLERVLIHWGFPSPSFSCSHCCMTSPPSLSSVRLLSIICNSVSGVWHPLHEVSFFATPLSSHLCRHALLRKPHALHHCKRN